MNKENKSQEAEAKELYGKKGSFHPDRHHAGNPINSAVMKPDDNTLSLSSKQGFSAVSGASDIISKINNEPAARINNSELVAKINILGKRITSGKSVPGIISHPNEKPHGSADYAGFIKEINEIIRNSKDSRESLNAFHNLFVNKLNALYTALGKVNGPYADIRLLDKSSNVYSLKIFMSEDDNEAVKALKSGAVSYHTDSEFLKLPAFAASPGLIVPAVIGGSCTCVLITGGYTVQNYTNLYQLAASNLGLIVQNESLADSANQKSYIDSLTNLYSHRRFHELLENEISDAKKNNTKVSVIILDLGGTGEINREYGHAAGDEVIRTAANKINACIKKQDIAARYGGDKFAVILKNTNSEEAKYTAEYITYSLSCCQADNIGFINKAALGIASYPDDSTDKEKLLILAEQAVLVSKAKGCKNGRAAIVSVQDKDFWDDTALNSFAAIMAKRHSLLGINFEDAVAAELQSANNLSKTHLIEIVKSLASAIDAKDKYTKDHSSSVSRYSAALANALNLPEDDVERIKLGALLHDIGKIGIPEDVLNKPSKLTEEEFNIIKQHPVIAVKKILEPNPALHNLIPIVKYHHEQWNGKGYPDGLKGEEIPLDARIAAIADTFHALISSRPYRKGMSIEKACRILEEGAGIQWDKELVRQFIAIAPSLAVNI